MTSVEQRPDPVGELRRPRMVSGPQGPRVVLDGKPVVSLCSGNALGLADHPKVREAAADAAMRWGVGAGASRLVSGSMTVHRRLEERLAAFTGTDAAVLFGSGYLANLGVLGALAAHAGPRALVCSDALNHASIVDGCRLSGAEAFVYDHADAEHLAWGLARAQGRPALVVTDAVFAMDGDVAPLEDLVEVAGRHGARVVVDEAHGLGCLGPGGRGAVAEAGLEDEVDVVVGTLGKALGSYGGWATCSAATARVLLQGARPLLHSTAPPPPAVAGALAALGLVEEQPRRVEKLQANGGILRDELAREGFDVAGSSTHIVPLVVGSAGLADRLCELGIEQGAFAEAVRAPDVPEGTARLRLAVMASHTKPELREAAQALGRAALRAGFRPGAGLPVAAAQDAAAGPSGGVFDGQAPQRRAA
jgi:glycine C-acetyltransferase/8-amino-7-oxononanoate synthase